MARRSNRLADDPGPPSANTAPCACVAIGVSSSRVDVLMDLFRAMPANVDAAFTVAIRADNAGDLPPVVDRLAALTPMTVKLGEDGEPLKRNHVYVADGAGLMTVKASQIRLTPFHQPPARKGAVDSLLVSVSESSGEAAVIVVLAGLGHDGATGMAATKRCGGFGLAETPPGGLQPEDQASTTARIADLCLPVERIPGEIVSYIRTLAETEQADRAGQVVQDNVGQTITRIAAILRNATGNDFHGYKHATFLRRVQRRMQVVQVTGIEAYAERLRNDAGEAQHLVHDLRIGGTRSVLFQGAGASAEGMDGGGQAAAADEHVARLEGELRLTRERLQTAIEELQTSKEELQTVNGELANRVGDLARANGDLKNLLESTQIATLFLDSSLRLRSFTPSASDIFHLIDADVGRPIAHVSSRLAYPQFQEDARRVLNSLGPIERDVSAAEEDRRFQVRILPYRSVDDFIAGVVVTFLEITGAARAQAALRRSEHRFRALVTASSYAVYRMSPDWSEIRELEGRGFVSDVDSPSANWLQDFVAPEDQPLLAAAIARAVAAKQMFELEHRVRRADGALGWTLSRAVPLLDEDGAITEWFGAASDITSRKQGEERQKLLLHELQHRVRNILGVVRSIISSTVRTASNLDELASHLDGRMQTLARTQAVFTRSGDSAQDLEDMVRDEMLAVAAREDQITIEGPRVGLLREAAEIFALALHELATNALKYGALSRPDAKIAVRWRVVNTGAGPRLSLEWQESGVPAVDIAPARSGFGRDLIERGLPYELGATTALEFGRGGARALIELPLTSKIAALDQLEAGM